MTTQRFHLWIVLLMLNDLFRVYMETKTNLKESTESNYRYLWEHYIQHEPIALTSEQAKHFLQYIELIIIIPSFSNYNNVSFVSD